MDLEARRGQEAALPSTSSFDGQSTHIRRIGQCYSSGPFRSKDSCILCSWVEGHPAQDPRARFATTPRDGRIRGYIRKRPVPSRLAARISAAVLNPNITVMATRERNGTRALPPALTNSHRAPTDADPIKAATHTRAAGGAGACQCINRRHRRERDHYQLGERFFGGRSHAPEYIPRLPPPSRYPLMSTAVSKSGCAVGAIFDRREPRSVLTPAGKNER